MKILGIETSCDETAIAVVEGSGDLTALNFQILSSVISSQVKVHAPFGGVVPMLAKREHAKNLVPVLEQCLRDSGLYLERSEFLQATSYKLQAILARESDLITPLTKLLQDIVHPAIDAIAVTQGPGLEPALWVGINFAKALAHAWQKPLYPINHMEGHIIAALLGSNDSRRQKAEGKIEFPLLSLLVSGGHTELDLATSWGHYKTIGQTRDDAVGEAFDKVARLLGLPYPGGPQISELARRGQANNKINLPRPMIKSDDFDFSFAGLKTAVLYLTQKIGTLDDQTRADIALEFQNAVVETLVAKTVKALDQTQARTFILGGGVAANTQLRETLANTLAEKFPDVLVIIPDRNLTTDNAAMIAGAGYLHALRNQKSDLLFKATDNLHLGHEMSKLAQKEK